MYSGTTLKPFRRFDAWFGAHQKIDRVARGHLGYILPDVVFPKKQDIIRFEGIDGPDGIKRKTPAKDEPWHYINPEDASDRQLVEIITEHYQQLVAALKTDNMVRAAFESAWLSHAVVDGLTPAHHYPYEEELVKLRGGAGIETRTTPKEKLLMPGETLTKQIGNNWKMWGDKGLLATHFAFEWGVATMILPLRLGRAYPTAEDMEEVRTKGVGSFFLDRVHLVNTLQTYEQFYQSGWTPRLAKTVRRELVPTIVNTVTMLWYAAALEAQA
jgi:hypothetical protein